MPKLNDCKLISVIMEYHPTPGQLATGMGKVCYLPGLHRNPVSLFSLLVCNPSQLLPLYGILIKL